MAKLKDGTRIYGNANVDSTLTTADLVVTGNITIRGTTTTVDSTSTTIKDPLITLGAAEDGTVPNDGHERGLILKYNDGATKTGFMGWDTSGNQFALAATTTFDSANNEVTIGTYGNVQALHFIGEGDTLGNITGGNVTGTVLNANMSQYAGNVTNASQGNITSLGNLTGLQVGNATTTGKVVVTTDGTINATGNVSITSSSVSTTSSSGALTVTGGAGIGGNLYVGGNIYGNFAGEVLAKGSNTYVQFNDDSKLNGTAGFTFKKDSNTLTVTGTANVGNLETAGYANVSGTANVGNLVTPGYANIDGNLLIGKAGAGNAASANITGNLLVADTANVGNLIVPGTGDIKGVLTVGTSGTAANANVTGNLTVGYDYSSTNGNIALTNGNITIGGGANVTGIANVGNLTTGGNIDGTGSSSTANVKYLEIRSTANIAGTANVGNLVTPGYANIDKDLLVGKAGGGANSANANITGSLTVGSITGDLLPTTQYGGNLGGFGKEWKDLWLSGSSIKIGTQTISTTTSGSGGIQVSNNLTVTTLEVGGDANIGNSSTVGNLKVFGTVWANGNISSNTLTNSYVTFADGNVLSGNANFTFDKTSNSLLKTGNLELTTLANVANIKVRALTDNAIPYTSAITANTLAADSTFTFEPANGLLKVGNVELTGTANVNNATVRTLTTTGGIVFGNSFHGLVDHANLSFDTSGNTLTTDNLGLYGTANVGNVVLRSLANTQLSFANATNVLVGSANLTFDATSKTLSADLFTGTLTTASQPNITSTGTLTSLVVSGDLQSNANVITDNIITKTDGNLNITAGTTHGNIVLAPTGASGTVSVSSKKITNLAEPTADTDAATKYYVDHIAQGLHVHGPAQAATTANLTSFTLSSPYQIDGYTLQDGDRVLVKNQLAQADNGIYVYTASTHILSRADDANLAADLAGGDFIFVVNGSTYGDTGWVQTEVVVTLGSTNVIWQQFSGAGSYTGGESYGIHFDGTVIQTKINTGTMDYDVSGNLKVADSASFVTPNIGNATGSNLNLSTGNLTAGNATIGTGSGGSITGANLVSANYFTGTITTNAQPNINSLGTLDYLNVSNASGNGTVVANYVKTDNLQHANGSAWDFATAAGGNTQIQYSDGTDLVASANLTFDDSVNLLTVTGNAIITSTATIGTVVSANIQANNLTDTHVVFAGTDGKLVGDANLAFDSSTANLTVTGNIKNVTGAIISGNIQANNVTATHVMFAGTDGKLVGNGNLTFSGTQLDVTGTANVSDTVNAGNVTSNGVTATHVVFADTGGRLTSNVNLTFSGTQLAVTGTANISGTVNAGNVTSNGVTATELVYATTGGRLTSNNNLTFNGTELTANAANITNAFTAANVTSRGLVSGRVTIAGSGGLLSDSNNFKFSTGTNVMTVTGNIQLNDTGIAGTGSLTGNGAISMTGNITGSNLEATSGGLILTTGNANVGNLNATYIAGTLVAASSSQPNITSVGSLANLTVSGKSHLGPIANVEITGGTVGQVIVTDGAGNLSFVTKVDASGKIVNGNSNVSIPTIDSDILMVSAGNTVITVKGLGANVTGYIDVTGNITGNNISIGNIVTANGTTDSTSSITGTIITTGGIGATGNIYTGHSVGFANNNGGTASKAYIQYNDSASSLDFIFN